MKNKIINITANSTNQQLIDLFPIKRAKDAYPNWFKRLKTPSNRDRSDANVKVCPGLTDLYNNSLIINSWQDYEITVNSNGSVLIKCPNHEFSAVSHTIASQAAGAWPNYVNVKLTSPWFLTSTDSTFWLMTAAIWSQSTPSQYVIVPGVLEFKIQNQTNINLLFPILDHNKTYTIKAGDPLVTLTPMSSNAINLNLKYITYDQLQKLTSRWNFSFSYTYHKIRSMIKG